MDDCLAVKTVGQFSCFRSRPLAYLRKHLSQPPSLQKETSIVALREKNSGIFATMDSPRPLPSDHRRERLAAAFKDNLLLLFGLLAVAWGLEIVDFLLRGLLDNFGIRPRTISGIGGVFASPFLHQGFGHLISNSVPFLILGGVVLVGGRKVFLLSSLFILCIGGMAVWTLGPGNTNHIGASLLIFGYLGFLLARGIFEKSPFWIVVSLVILAFYGGMLVGVLPGQPGISWQGHLFGFLAGVIAAKVLFTSSVADPGNTNLPSVPGAG